MDNFYKIKIKTFTLFLNQFLHNNITIKSRNIIITSFHGADEGNRTLIYSLGSCYSTIELHPQKIIKQIIFFLIECNL